MNNQDLLLAIDCGTQSLKALVFDLNGNLLDKEQILFTPYFSENPGPSRIRRFSGRPCAGPAADYGRKAPYRKSTSRKITHIPVTSL